MVNDPTGPNETAATLLMVIPHMLDLVDAPGWLLLAVLNWLFFLTLN